MLTSNPTRALTSSIVRPITQAGAGGGGFDYTTLWEGGVKGFAYDPAMSTLSQDDAGATPISASGQTLGAMTDTSGNGWTAVQATSGSRPQYLEDDGGRKFIRVLGAKFMSCASVNLSGCSAFTAVAAFRTAANSSSVGHVFEHGSASFSSGGFSMSESQQVAGDFGSNFGVPGAYRFLNTSGTYQRRTDRVVTMQIYPDAATDADRLKVWVNGVIQPTATYLTAGTTADTLFTTRTLNLFSRNGIGDYGQFDFFFIAGVGRVLTQSERENLEAVAASRMTVTPAYGVVSYGLSRAAELRPDYALGSAYAVAEWDTSATSVDVAYNSPLRAYAAGMAYIGTYVDGAYYSQTACPASSGTLTIALPVGSKRVSLVCSPIQFSAESTDKYVRKSGGWVTGATFNAAATRVTPATSGGLVIYGDSIAMGQGASPLHQKAWAMQVRSAYPSQNVTVEGGGAISLHDVYFYSDELASLVSDIASSAPSEVWLAIGTNDYGLNKWNAASFGTAYAALLDALHVALPSATIYCQTPILRTTETANGSGSTLGDYRTAIGTAVSTRTAYATLVDGTDFMTTASLSDGVHPSTAGHDLYAAAVITELGL